jgi:predicted aspartyl protease
VCFRILLAALAAAGLALAGMAAAAAPGCEMVPTEEWPVRLAHNKLIVDGAINGQKVGIMLDTGATKSLIFRSAAVRLGLDTRLARGYEMFGVGGTTDVEIAFIDEFKVGEATRKGWRMMVAGEHDPGDDVAVLLGEDFFRHVDVEFDLAHNAVRLFQFQPKDCDRVSLAYWTTDASVVGIEPVFDPAPQIVLTIQINGKPVRALLDSGAGASMLEKSAAARLGVTPETPGVVAAGSSTGLGRNAVDFWIGPFQSFAIGDEMIKDTTILFGDLWKRATYTGTGSYIPKKMQGEQQMLLGADFLRAHRLLVAHSQRRIYFTYGGGPVFRRAEAPENSSDPAGTRP